MALIPFRHTFVPGRQPKVDPADRIYAVGDIHGRLDLLVKLLRRIVADAESFDDGRRTRLVFLGDYVDRGDASARVLDVLSDLATAPGENAIFLIGNHEDAMLKFLDDPVRGASWLALGGLQTLASYGIGGLTVARARAEAEEIADRLLVVAGRHLDFLSGLSPRFRSGDVVFSHAGVDPQLRLEDQNRDTLTWGHPDALCDQPLRGLCVVHGHYDDPEPVIRPGRICVDTGAYYSGVLTAVRLDDEQAILSTAD